MQAPENYVLEFIYKSRFLYSRIETIDDIQSTNANHL